MDQGAFAKDMETGRKIYGPGRFYGFQSYGEDKRSLCTFGCKWTYLGHEKGAGSWDYTFFERIGLTDLFENEKVPEYAHPIGNLAGRLTEKSAHE